MSATCVVILSSRSIFVEGVAARLRQIGGQQLHVVETQAPDALQQIVALAPTAVILDATDEEITRRYPLNVFFNALPALKVVRLDPEQSHFQVITSHQHTAEQVSDLLSVLA